MEWLILIIGFFVAGLLGGGLGCALGNKWADRHRTVVRRWQVGSDIVAAVRRTRMGRWHQIGTKNPRKS